MLEADRKIHNQGKLVELHPVFRSRVQAVLLELESAGLRPRITEAWRSAADQEAAYKNGTSQVLYGFHNVTMADGGKEALAADIIDDDNPQTTGTGFMLRLAAAAEKNRLLTGIRWGLSDEKAQAVNAALAAGNWDASIHAGWDPLHVEITGLTTAEARQGKRPLAEGNTSTNGGTGSGESGGNTSEGGKRPVRTYQVEELGTARIVQYELGNPLRPVALLPVPYVSQLGEEAQTRVNDCGPACVVMLLRAYQKSALTPDEFYARFAIKGDPYLHASQLMSAMGTLGLQTEFRSGLTVQDLFGVLAAGKPAIVLLGYKAFSEAGLTEKMFAGPHFAVAVGLDVKNIYLHDPLYTDPLVGEAHPYPLEVFWKAWKEASAGLQVPNPERAAIIPVQGIGFQGLRRVKVNIGILNVREGPGLSNRIVGTLKRNEIIEIQREVSGWGEVGFNRWVMLSYTLPVA
jgi:hypothetical protein